MTAILDGEPMEPATSIDGQWLAEAVLILNCPQPLRVSAQNECPVKPLSAAKRYVKRNWQRMFIHRPARAKDLVRGVCETTAWRYPQVCT